MRGDQGTVLGRAIGGQRRHVGLAALFAASHQAGEALVPVVIGVVIDTAVATGSVTRLVLWLAVLAAVFAVLSFSWRFGARAAERASEWAAHDLRVDLTRRILHPGGGAETGRLAGELANIATGDAGRVGGVNVVLPSAIAALTGFLVSAVALLWISVPLGLVVLLGAPPLLWLGHLLGRPLERRSAVEQERAAHASGVAADLVAGLRVLKGIGAERAAVDRYRGTSQESLAATLRAARTQAAHDGAILALTGVFIAAVALVGGRLAASGDISVGDLVAAVGLALFLLNPLQLFAWVNAELAQGRASAKRIAAVLAAPAAVTAGGARLPDPVRGRVTLTGVHHGPLSGVDLEVAPGELLGVVAPDPAAATALLSALARDADPAEGEVALDGVPLSTLDPADLRGAILVAAHHATLFAGPLLANVTPAYATAGGVDRALAAASADEVARSLPDGVDTVLGERAQSLSGGQRQRVALARALAADPPVLVLHDPTTAVDAVTESRIAAGIREIRAGRTTVVVTTSPALLAATDRVAVLDGGTVTAVGRHADLVATDATYRATVLQ
ncbi:ABC transporter ATP-binding protein [Phytohabitans houttuyneae]|uniref:Multidrug ABC transporter ATP-binding protein n=1 Tax=Phytohabitans houttuyneae TaxID=1076126 RepID=A0A6V8KR48_9ACTN|nr:ABC transporter ATP-binding protein [Phytohabitans houttuyneae]GFJ83115.1 multidrug ABC transporter ATP-binding protein [Phytohabitans houttuyneae]